MVTLSTTREFRLDQENYVEYTYSRAGSADSDLQMAPFVINPSADDLLRIMIIFATGRLSIFTVSLIQFQYYYYNT